jgi:hypothetical protein
MKRWISGLRGGALALCASAAVAAPHGGGAARAMLFTETHFHGHWLKLGRGSADLTEHGFSGKAMSGHFDGDWTLCDAAAYGGHCTTVSGDVADFSTLGFDHTLISLRPGGVLLGANASTAAAPQPPELAPPPQAAGASESSDDGYFDRSSPAEPPGAAPADAALPPAARTVLSQGVAGHSSVFFIRPQRDGADVPGGNRDAADAFCRDHGLGPALYFDAGSRILRDVLCRLD